MAFCFAYLVFLLLYVALNPGGVPFGYCIEALSLKLFGLTASAARLPAVIFSIGTCLALARLSHELKLRIPFISVSVMALSPIYVRL